MEKRTIYNEDFKDSPGVWTMGKSTSYYKDKNTWHKNMLGYYGEGIPLGYDSDDNCAYTYSPWYFDDNHGEFAWLYLACTARSERLGIVGKDLRDGDVKIRIRGNGLDLKGASLLVYIQGLGGSLSHYTSKVFYCWALSSRPENNELLDDKWHDISIKLVNDERKWSSMGLINGGLARKVKVTQSLCASEGSLEPILGGAHYGIGFLLCYIDPVDQPTGRIDFAKIGITGREDEVSKARGIEMLEFDRNRK